MTKKILCLLVLIFLIQLVNAAEVCVVVDYGDDKPDSKCIDIDEGKNGYDLMQETGFNLLWSPNTTYGHMLCKINDIGTDVSGNYCAYSGEFWNLVLNINKEWLHLPVGFDGQGGCWNYDINSYSGHYCTKDKDVLGFAFGEAGSKPNMFKANITKIYINGEKQKDSDTRRGKIGEVFPGSSVEFKIELENLYDSKTDIDIEDISIEGVIEEIDDGDDIEEEIKEFDLEADKKDSKKLEFKIPLEVEEKDRLLTIEIKADDNAGIKYEKEFTYDLEIEKEKHKLKITKAELNKDSYKCGENALLSFSILNIGKKNENVNLEITNEDLEIDVNEDFELTNDAFEDSSKFEKRFNIWLPENIDKTTYSISITAEYSGEREIENPNLVLEECEKEIVETGESKESEEITETQIPPPLKEEQIEETINENLHLVLTAVLAVLIVMIIGLGIMFLVVRR